MMPMERLKTTKKQKIPIISYLKINKYRKNMITFAAEFKPYIKITNF